MRRIWPGGILTAVACASIVPPAEAQSYASLETVLGWIRTAYATPVDMAPLAEAAIEAARIAAGVENQAWSRCRAGLATASPPPATDSAALADITNALRCAETQGKSGIAIEKIVDAAIGAMVAKLDPLSRWVTPDEMARMQSRAQSPGSVGLALRRHSDRFSVVRVAADGPAREEGIEPEDELVAIDGAGTAGLSLEEAITKLRGAENSLVTLTMRRPGGEMRDVPLHRRVGSALDTDLQTERRGSVLILRLYSMANGVTEAVKREVTQRDPVSAVILDLRDNPGGLLEETIALADLFLDKGVIVTSRGQTKRDVETYSARKGQSAKGVPIVVLINHATAAGAEILAAALQDNKRALVLGQESAGAGSVQTVLPIDANHMLRFTTSYEYRADGRRLSDAPVAPDCIGNPDPNALLEDAAIIAIKGAAACTAPAVANGPAPRKD